ncbi:MAG: hypothetical protein WC975_08740 [Phycisphaerae bacterium]
MEENRMDHQIESISELLAFVILYDPETLFDLQSWFAQIARLARETSQPEVSLVALAAAKVSEKIIASEENDTFLLNFITDQEGGSALDVRHESLAREKIKEQLINELMGEAVKFRIGYAPFKDKNTKQNELLMPVA